jgi:hypothetical protein
MTSGGPTGSGSEGSGGSPEPTIADVMNAFSLDSGRKPKRRRWGRQRGEDADHHGRHEQGQRPGGADGDYAEDLYAADGYSGDRSFGTPSFDHNDFKGPEPDVRSGQDGVGGFGAEPHRDEWDEIESSGATFVRPYAWTRGRTRTGYSLEIETLVTTSQRGREQLALLQLEHRAVADLCQQARSVAEVAALLKVPLGVAKVLVGDMAGIGLVAVHESVSTHGDIPDLALMERVLSGLRRL